MILFMSDNPRKASLIKHRFSYSHRSTATGCLCIYFKIATTQSFKSNDETFSAKKVQKRKTALQIFGLENKVLFKLKLGFLMNTISLES